MIEEIEVLPSVKVYLVPVPKSTWSYETYWYRYVSEIRETGLEHGIEWGLWIECVIWFRDPAMATFFFLKWS